MVCHDLCVAKKLEPQPTSDQAALQIRPDGLGIITADNEFHLPKTAVDQLVSSLIISGFGPQTVAQYNTVLTFRDLKNEKDAKEHSE